MLKIVRNNFSALFTIHYSLFTIHYSLFISMEGVYAENRLERFQCTIHYSLFVIHCFTYLTANKEPFTLLKYTRSSLIATDV
jgi:hypothetical protein